MAIAFGTNGTPGSGTTSVNCGYPASTAAGDLLVLYVANKYPNNGPSTPSGWTAPANNQATGSSGSAGGDTGAVYVTVFYKIADGTESGSLAVTVSSGNCAFGRISRYTKLSSAVWDVVCANGADNTAGTTWSVTAGADPGVRTGDMLLVASGINSNNYTYTLETVTQSGVVFGTMAERNDNGSTLGDNCGLLMSEHPVTSGTSSAAPVYTATASGSATNSPAGASVFIRLRELGPIFGQADVVTAESGALVGDGALVGTSDATAAETGDLTGAGALAGQSDATTTASAAAAGGQLISGTADAVASQSGTLDGAGALVGAAAAVAAETGALTASGDLAGASAAAADQSGTLLGAAAAAGASDATTTATGDVTGAAALLGTSDATAALTGTLAGAGVLTGTSAATAGAIVSLEGSGVLAGTSDATTTESGAVTGVGALVGAADAVADANAVLLGAADIAGLAAALADQIGGLGGFGALAGTADAIADALATGTLILPAGFITGTASAITGQSGTLLGLLAFTASPRLYTVPLADVVLVTRVLDDVVFYIVS